VQWDNGRETFEHFGMRVGDNEVIWADEIVNSQTSRFLYIDCAILANTNLASGKMSCSGFRRCPDQFYVRWTIGYTILMYLVIAYQRWYPSNFSDTPTRQP
jgi:hypothetical protein